MNFIHFSAVCRNEKDSDIFYGDVLGLKKIKTSLISNTIINKISDIDRDIKIVLYGSEKLSAEVFIFKDFNRKRTLMNHICIDVKDRPAFIQKCNILKLNVTEIPKGDNILVFITDFDNNLFEVKQSLTPF